MATVRLLRPDEADVLRNVAPDVFDHAVDPAQTAAFFADPRHHLAVALDGTLVVGMASAVEYVHPDKPPALWINEVGVAPDYQRRGLGKRLVAVLLERGRALGCTEAWVATEVENEAARRLYETSGGGTGEPFVMYTFPLGAD